MSEPKRYNEWYGLMYQLEEADRKSWVEQVISDIKAEAKRKKSKEMAALAKFLENPKKCHIIGFAPGLEYLLAKNDGRDDWNSSFIHPTAQACLIVKVKGLPVFMSVGATLDYNKSDLPIKNVLGATS